MSKTIITNSGSKFFTNVSSEQLIGLLCKISGAKYTKPFLDWMKPMKPDMAYTMTEEEANETAEKLRGLIPRAASLVDECKPFFKKTKETHSLIEAIKYFLNETAEEFEISKGYKCV
jgi:hypothetical protein